ncbi:response regulator [Methylorubrum extorquens]|uniref:response regulator n=1 Tax=Methylorubrum extorquens TaxID=408 RepID=UPI000158F50A|nr:hypothetical protein Mext_0144 [Methylorubrum extorquens PA1]
MSSSIESVWEGRLCPSWRSTSWRIPARVVEAATADEAWAILESRGDVAALFTDIEMSGSMNGFALADRVAKRWPHIRPVITSGRCRPAPCDLPDQGMFVPKPYMADQVLTAFERARPL